LQRLLYTVMYSMQAAYYVITTNWIFWNNSSKSWRTQIKFYRHM